MSELIPQMPSPQINIEGMETKQTLEKDFARVLESGEEKNKDIYVTEKIITTPPQGLAGLFDKVSNKYKAIIGVLVFAATYNLSTGAVQIPDGHHFFEDNEFSQTAEKKSEIKKITGIDIAGEAEKVGRGVKFYTPEQPTDLTVIHIGQVHNAGDYTAANWKFKDSIIKSQSEISSFVMATSTVGSKIFVEGYSENYIQTLDKDATHHNLKDTVTQIEAAESFEVVKNIYDKTLSDAPAELQDTAIINKVTGEKLTSLGFIETSPLVYTKGAEHFALYESGFLPKGKEYTASNAVDSGLSDAVAELEAKGKIAIEPAEDARLNEEAFKSINEITKSDVLVKLYASFGQHSKYYGKIMNKTFSATDITADPNFIEEIQTLSKSTDCRDSVECQHFVKEVNEVTIPTAKKVVIEDREDAAIELIAKNASSTHQHVFPLVYGTGHDFTRAITKWNSTHPNMRFNLVTVK